MPSAKVPNDTWTRLALSILKLNGFILRTGDSIINPIGQSSARWQVLGRAYEPQTVAAIAHDMGHARQSVQRVADILVKEGVLAYKNHPTDRRTKLLYLTPQGKATMKAIYNRQLQWSNQIVSLLGDDYLIRSAHLLEELNDKLEAATNTDKGG